METKADLLRIFRPMKQLWNFCEAIEKAGYTAGSDIVLATDVAASELLGDDGLYHLSGDHAAKTAEQMIEFYDHLISEYPIVSIEDGLEEEDWEGWKLLTDSLGDSEAACWGLDFSLPIQNVFPEELQKALPTPF